MIVEESTSTIETPKVEVVTEEVITTAKPEKEEEKKISLEELLPQLKPHIRRRIVKQLHLKEKPMSRIYSKKNHKKK